MIYTLRKQIYFLCYYCIFRLSLISVIPKEQIYLYFYLVAVYLWWKGNQGTSGLTGKFDSFLVLIYYLLIYFREKMFFIVLVFCFVLHSVSLRENTT